MNRLQKGLEPTDFKHMPEAGKGVQEIRIRDKSGIYRVLCVTKFRDFLYVLHCFQKKTQKTFQSDIDLARARYAELVKEQKK